MKKFCLFLLLSALFLSLSAPLAVMAETDRAEIIGVSVNEKYNAVAVELIYSADGDALLIAALYDGGKLLETRAITVSSGGTFNMAMRTALSDLESLTVKAFLWDGKENMVPLNKNSAPDGPDIPEPTPAPGATPTAKPTLVPGTTPTPVPTATPKATPTAVPTPTPTPTPEPFNGVKVDSATGLLVPTAFFNKVLPTFEDGKEPEFFIYVAEWGNDSPTRGDGSFEKPYESISRACKDLKPGGAVRIMPGTYSTNLFGYSKNHNLFGTEEKPVWLGGVPGMERPVIGGPSGSFFITDFSYAILHDMDIVGNTGGTSSINMVSSDPSKTNAHHAILRNLYCYDNATGTVTLKFAQVEDVTVYDCDIKEGGGFAIDFVGCHKNRVAYNYIHDTGNTGVKMKGGSADSEIFGNLFFNVEGNTVDIGQDTGEEYFNPPFQAGVSYEAQRLHVYSNVFYKCKSAFSFWGTRDCYAVNNTVVLPTHSLVRVLPSSTRLANSGKAHYDTISNNIFYSTASPGYSGYCFNISSSIGVTNMGTFTVDSNIFRSTASPASLPYFEVDVSHTNSKLVDPLFTGNVLTMNLSDTTATLKLNTGSPAIGAGSSVPFPMKDYRGKDFKSSKSIGAIEDY